MRASCLAIAAAALRSAVAQNRPFPIHIIPQATADMFGAKCLDGTPPGFYWKPAVNPAAATKWKVHFRGGAWCYSPDDCNNRLRNELGSSLYYAPDAYNSSEAVYGLMNDNSTNAFGDWNAVWAPYCDGASWMGDHEEPFIYNNTQIWQRGFRNLQAMLYEMNVLNGFLDNATEVIITGTSAGGDATALHSGYIKSQLKQAGARLVAVPDAGWWWDAANVNGHHTFAEGFIEAYGPQFWNASARALDRDCLAAYPPSQQYQCTMTDGAYATALAPGKVDGVFVMQSLYDSAQLGMEFVLGCDPWTSCNASQLQSMQDYRVVLQARVEAGQAVFGQRDGAFMTACYQHEETCRDFDWYGIQIGPDSLTANQTFYNWYYKTGGPTRAVDTLWPNNPTCQPPGVTHGSC